MRFLSEIFIMGIDFMGSLVKSSESPVSPRSKTLPTQKIKKINIFSKLAFLTHSSSEKSFLSGDLGVTRSLQNSEEYLTGNYFSVIIFHRGNPVFLRVQGVR